MSGIFKAVGGVFKSVLGGGDVPKSQPMPKVSKPTPMPTEDSPAVKEAKRRKMQSASNRQGRLSTILSDDTDTFGN